MTLKEKLEAYWNGPILNSIHINIWRFSASGMILCWKGRKATFK